MPPKLATADYRALAELRYRIRHFLYETDAAARRGRLEPQQYLLLLAVRGLPKGTKATVGTLAERLALKHNSAVELLDRMEKRGYLRRVRSRGDRRRVRVSLMARGRRLLGEVARERITELRSSGIAFVDAIDALLGHKRKSRGRRRAETVRYRAAKGW